MYHRATTAAAVDAASRAQIADQQAKGVPAEKQWALQYYHPTQIEHAISHLDDLYDRETGQMRRALRPDELQFVQNERRLCKLDYRHFADNYVWIVDWKQQHSRFAPNVAQNIVRDIWGTMEADGLAIWMQQLKARRLGVSTETEMATLHRFMFYEHTAAVVAAATPKNSVALAGMMRYAFKHMPWWLIPQTTKIANDMPVEFESLHSTLSIQAGNQFTGVARGATPNTVHLSELCEWQDAELLVDAALMRAIIDHPLVFGVMESTALGTGNWWHNQWLKNKREYAEKRARVRPVFLPWYVGTDIYPSPSTLAARPIPADWVPMDRTINHAERARQYVLSDPLLFEHLAKGSKRWRMPKAQMWFYELEYENARRDKTLNLFLGEMASDDFSCFQSTNIPIIDTEILQEYRERTREPLGVFTIVGPDIPEALVVPRHYWNYDLPPITINTASVTPRYPAKYQLIPLKFEGYPTFDPNNRLLIWEFPDEDHTYGVGADTSGGTGGDNAVMEVLREATPMRPPGQVAEYVNDKLTAFQMWPLMMAVSAYFSTYSLKLGKVAQARAAIECMGTGEVVQHEMQKRGWVNFHPWKRYDDKVTRPDGEVRKIGIYTNAWFRPQMLDMVITSLDEQAIDIPSPYMIDELSTLEREPGVQKIKAAYGAHDDRVFALGFPLFSLHMGKPPSKQYTRQRIALLPGGEAAMTINHPIWTPPSQASSRPFQPAMQLHRESLRGGVALLRYVNRQMPEGFR
jgi:hypothetical protein